MSEFLYTFNGADRASDGSLHERECYPWEYEQHAQYCLREAFHCSPTGYSSDKYKWNHQQAKIFQDRAEFIRQQWAKQQAKQEAVKQATEQAKKQAEQAELKALLQAIQEAKQAVTEQAQST